MADIIIKNLVIGNQYSLNFIAPAILGTGLKDATLTGIMDFGMAVSLENVAQTHENVRPFSDKISESPNGYNYLMFRKGGVRTIVSTAWIEPNSLTEVNRRNALVTVEIRSDDDKRRIADMLQRAGYVVSSITG